MRLLSQHESSVQVKYIIIVIAIQCGTLLLDLPDTVFDYIQVDGKTLCLLCTIKYKKDQFKKRNGADHSRAGSGRHSSGKRAWQQQDSEHKAKSEADSGSVASNCKSYVQYYAAMHLNLAPIPELAFKISYNSYSIISLVIL